MEFPWVLPMANIPLLTSPSTWLLLKCLYISTPHKAKLLVIFKAAHLDFLPNLTADVITQTVAAISDSTCSGRVVPGLAVGSDYWCWYLFGSVQPHQTWAATEISGISYKVINLEQISQRAPVYNSPCLLPHFLILQHKIQYWQLSSPATKHSPVPHLPK